MKKCLLLFFLCFVLVSNLNAGSILFFRGTAASGPSPDFIDDFNHTDDSDAGANSTLTETDTEGQLDIYSNEMRWVSGTPTDQAFVSSVSLSNQTEITIKFKIRFSDVIGVDNSTGTLRFEQSRDSSLNIEMEAYFVPASGDLDCYQISYANDTETSACQDISSASAETDYWCYLYFLNDGSVGGVEMNCCANEAMDSGCFGATNTGFNDDTSSLNIDDVRFGAHLSNWGDGTAGAITIYWDDLQWWYSDQR